MSSSIDERIVSMEFDNQRFEKNIAQSTQSLEKFDETIDNSAKNISNSFIGVEDGISRLDLLFVGFYTKIGGYIADLTVKAGKFAKSLSIDQVTEGFSKYTAETLAVQTITSNTNNSLEKTYDILGDILDYTDKTSYHYDTMSNTIAKFANQGVALDKAATAVKGIANWAAISGAGIDKADITMNALIKSIGSGKMQLREWRTISQSANMGTTQFLETLIATGKELDPKKWAGVTTKNFEGVAFDRNQIVSSEILLATLEKYGDEETELGKKALAAASEAKTFSEAVGAVKDAVSTSWGTSFRYIFGNYEEAKQVWTGIQDAMLEVFTIGQQWRNDMLKIWHNSEIGGFKDALQGVSDLWTSIKNTVKPLGEQIKKALDIPSAEDAAKKLSGITSTFKNYTEELKVITSGGKRASTSLEEFADKMQKGKVSISDWKEITKDADVDMKEFINTIIATGKEMDPKKWKGIDEKNFQEKVFGKKGNKSLLTSDIFKSSVSKTFEEEISRWNEILERDGVSEKIEKFTKVLDFFKKVIDQVGSNLKSFGDIFKQAFGGVKETFSGFGEVVRTIGEFAGKVHGAVTTVISAVKESEIVKTIFESIAKIVRSIASPAFEFFRKVLEKLGLKFDEISNNHEGLVNFLKNLGEKIKELTDIIVNKGINPAVEKMGDIFGELKEKLAPLKETLSDAKEGISNFIKGFKNNDTSDVEKTTSVFSVLADALSKIVEVAGKIAGKAISAIKDIAGNLDFDRLMFTIKNVLMNGLLITLISFVKNLGNISSGIVSAVKTMKKANVSATLIPVAGSLLALALAITMIASIPTEKLAAAMLAITALFGEITGLATLLQKMSKKKGGSSKAITKIAGALILMSAAVLVLAIAVKKLGQMETGDLIKGVLAVTVLLGVLTAIMKTLSSEKTKSMTLGSLALIAMANAINILASSVKKLGELDLKTLAKGLGSVIILLGSFAGFAKLLEGIKIGVGTGLAILEISIALGILTKSVEKLGSMSFEQLVKGLGSVIFALIGIGAALNLFPEKGMIGISTGLVLVSVALELITNVIGKLGEMSIEDLAKSIIALGAALSVIGLSLKLFEGSMKGAVALDILSISLIPLTIVLKTLGKMNLKSLAKGIVSLGAGLAIMVAAAAGASGAIGGAIALTVIASAMVPFAIAVKMLSQIPLLELVKGMGALILALGAFALLAPAFVVILPVFDGLANSMLKMGLGVAALSAALALLNILGPIALNLVTDLITAFVLAIPDIAAAVGKGMVAIIQIFIDAAPQIIELISVIVVGILEVLANAVPKVIEIIGLVLIGVLDLLIEAVPKVLTIITELVVGICDLLIAAIPKFVEVAVTLIMSILDGLIELIPKVVDAGFRMLIAFINGIADAIDKNHGDLLKAGANLLKSIWEGFKQTLKSIWDKIKEKGGEFLSKIKEGFEEKIENFKQTVRELPGKAKEAITEKVTEIINAGKDLIDGFIEGINSKIKAVKDAVKGIAESAVEKIKNFLGIKSPSRVAMGIGEYFDQGFANGLIKYADLASDPAERLAQNAIDPMLEAANAIADISVDDLGDPVIRPVLDLSEIQNGASQIGALFGNQYGVGLSMAGISGSLRSDSLNSSSAPSFQFNIYASEGQDVNQLAEIVSQRVNSIIMSRNNVWK